MKWIHAEIKTFNCWDVSARIRASQQVVFVYHLQPRSCYHLAHETRRVCCFLPVLAVYGISYYPKADEGSVSKCLKTRVVFGGLS